MSIGISYSWDDDNHKNWVRTLAERLTNAGLDVIYDGKQRLGERLPHFMEQMVSRSDRVLVVCSAKYKQRFDGRMGGVGYEGNLISSEIVKNHGTRKFVPLLRGNCWNDALPICLDGVQGLDFRDDSLFEEHCKDLVSELQLSTSTNATAPSGDLNWTAQLTFGSAEVRDALANIRAQGHRYYRVIEMYPSDGGYEKTNNELIRALKEAVIWHGDHPWPISIGLLEFLLKIDDCDIVHDPYARTTPHADGLSYSLRMDHMQRFEYVEARRDCSVMIVETEDFHWSRRDQLMLDKAIGTTSDALKFWQKFYETLLGCNPVALKMRWHGLQGLRLTVMDERFLPQAQTLAASPRICNHANPIKSETLHGPRPSQSLADWEKYFLKRTTGFLFGQFRFDPPDQLINDVLTAYQGTLSGPPTGKATHT